ncbi:hypothetical protein SCHPADRAFT_928474 [Schizopora paradoxa]|uniref:DUF6533 domain-containing protein n=1 Tax=Schizopora paradoxa TaxID=27342 RepID=A0A0H2RVR5_9AGAM|nr:hypothetical protein SCHPADRAFT_928474 [Schizopora paradoxa]
MSEALNAIAGVLSDEFNVKCMHVSNAALLTYDTIINFRDEEHYIWRSSWSIGKFLYLFSRYCAFVDLFLYLRLNFDSSLTPKQCHSTFVVFPWMITVGVLSSEAILITRTFAIYSRSYILLAYLVTMRVATVIPSLVIISQWNKGMKYLDSPAPTLAPCIPNPDHRIKLWLDFLFISIFDCHIVALTLFKAYKQWKNGLTKHRLVTTIYRDGIGYFVVLFMISITNLIFLNVEQNSVYFDFFVLFQRVMYAILASRIVINVRKAAECPLEGNSTSDHANSGLSGFGSRHHGGSLSALTVTTVTHRHVDGEDGMEMSWSPGGKICV